MIKLYDENLKGIVLIGLKSDFAYTRTNYNLVEEYKSLDAKGNSSIYEAGLSYPLIRSTNENLYLKGK